MSTTEIIQLNSFNGGMTSDDRSTVNNEMSLIQAFDMNTRAHRLTPNATLNNGDSASTTYEMTDFVNYNSTVYGLGHTSGGVHPSIRTKSLGNSGTTWTDPVVGTAHTVLPGAFVEYHGFLYGGYSDSYDIWKYNIGSPAFTDQDTTIAASEYITANGVVHSKDDILYFGCGRDIIKKNASTWTSSGVLTVPTGYTIVALCEYGDYLAIGCRTNRNGKSVVYLWDRNTALATVSESIDWGTGDIYVLKQLEEQLIGISLDTSATRNDPRVIFRQYTSGSGAIKVRELIGSAATTFSLGGSSIPNAQVVDNRLYFLAEMKLNGTQYAGIWGFGKVAADTPLKTSPYVVWFDMPPNGDTVVSGLKGMLVAGNVRMVAYNNSGYAIRQTTGVFYTGTSIIKTVLNPGMPTKHLTNQKQLKAVAVSMVPLPSDGQVVLKYAVDGGSMVTAKTETTTGVIVSEMDCSSLTGQTGREFQFQVESTGFAEITGIKYKYEVNETLL